jgi:DNA-directed RNA polymerase specialized sigma24 family protein
VAGSRDHGGPVDDARLRAFVAGEYPRVVATVELVCGSLPAAEDAVQEAMARAVERSRRGESIDRLA